MEFQIPSIYGSKDMSARKRANMLKLQKRNKLDKYL